MYPIEALLLIWAHVLLLLIGLLSQEYCRHSPWSPFFHYSIIVGHLSPFFRSLRRASINRSILTASLFQIQWGSIFDSTMSWSRYVPIFEVHPFDVWVFVDNPYIIRSREWKCPILRSWLLCSSSDILWSHGGVSWFSSSEEGISVISNTRGWRSPLSVQLGVYRIRLVRCPLATISSKSRLGHPHILKRTLGRHSWRGNPLKWAIR